MYEGDEIRMTGLIAEYVTGSAKMTELFITAPVTILSAGNDLPLPAVVTVPEMRDPVTAERWGNVYVKMYDVFVANNDYKLTNLDAVPAPASMLGLGAGLAALAARRRRRA